MTTAPQDGIARLPEVERLTGLYRSTVYARMADGLFPSSIPLGGARIGWLVREIQAVNQARIAGKTDDQIRELIVRLETERTGAPAVPRRKKDLLAEARAA